MTTAIATLWSSIPGIWRWVVVGFFAYGAIVTPLILAQTLRAYWNAPEAAGQNRKLAAVAEAARPKADS